MPSPSGTIGRRNAGPARRSGDPVRAGGRRRAASARLRGTSESTSLATHPQHVPLRPTAPHSHGGNSTTFSDDFRGSEEWVWGVADSNTPKLPATPTRNAEPAPTWRLPNIGSSESIPGDPPCSYLAESPSLLSRKHRQRRELQDL